MSKRDRVGEARFDPQALYEAIDAQRQARDMSWAQLSQDVRVSTSTIKGMPGRRWGIELDGVICLTRWLGRTVESFAGGSGGPAPRADSWRNSGRFLRFDTRACFDALDDERHQRGMSWDQVASQVWPNGPWGANQLKGMAKGGRSDVYSALAICEWLGRTIQSFEHETMF